MTEEEWLTSADAQVMLECLRPRASERKLRLFACAFVTERYGLDTAGLGDAIRKAEQWADGALPGDLGDLAKFYVCYSSAWQAADEGTVGYVENWGEGDLKKRFRLFLVDTLRDIFGNPFRTVAFDPGWRTADVMLLAQGIYDERAFDRMPIIADALQDAGCTNDDILAHCRNASAAHVRGCWALDLVLGKE